MRFRKPPLWESFSKTSVFSGVFIVLVYGTEGETHRKRWKRIGVDGVQAFRLVSGEKLNALCLRSLWLEWFLYSDKMAIPGVSVFLQDNHDFWPATIRCNSRQPSKFSHRLRSREKAEHKLFSSVQFIFLHCSHHMVVLQEETENENRNMEDNCLLGTPKFE